MTTVAQLVFSGILIGSIYALMSIGLTLIFGVLRVVNFAHGEFLMIAMYAAWAMTRYLGLDPYLAAVAIVPGMFLFGMLVHRLIINPALDKQQITRQDLGLNHRFAVNLEAGGRLCVDDEVLIQGHKYRPALP